MKPIFIEAKVQKIDKDIEKAIKNSGISYPHHALGFFKAVYAKIGADHYNLNGVALDEGVKEDVKYLIGTQVNKNHYRRGNILGDIISASVNSDNQIEVIFTFHKDVYDKEYEEALSLMDEDKLMVSFELHADKDNIIEKGSKKIVTRCNFVGCGLLFDLQGAEPSAYVFQTASIIDEASKIIEDALKNDNKQLLYASAENISKKWISLGNQIEKLINSKNENESQMGEINMDEKTKADLLAKQKAFVIEEFGEESVKEWTDDDFLNQDKIDALRESLNTSDTETNDNSEETQDEQASEDNQETSEENMAEASEENAAIQNRKNTETRVYDVTEDTEAGTMEVVETVKSTSEVDGKEIMNEEVIRHTLYTQAKVDELVNTAKESVKAEYETVIQAKDEELKQKDDLLASKDEEIKFTKENAQKIAEIRAEYSEFVKDYSDEELFDNDKIQIAQLKKENKELRDKQALKADHKNKENLTASTHDDGEVSREAQRKYAKKATGQI